MDRIGGMYQCRPFVFFPVDTRSNAWTSARFDQLQFEQAAGGYATTEERITRGNAAERTRPKR